jgi:major membrane immunogen (membrane-anchored lipoprotein)
MRALVLAICSLSLLVAGCASTETVKEAQGQDVSRSYPYAYDRVFDAVVDIELQGGK